IGRMNPMSLVRVEGSSKRLRQPRILSVKEFRVLLDELREPIRTMCIVAACLGLRASELVGLQWGDFDWKACEVHIQRGVVIGRVDEVKTTNSNRRLPVHPNLADLLVAYKAETAPGAGNCDWLFPSPYGTGRPRWPWTIQRDHSLPARIRAGVGPIGWHSFRHSYSTLLRSYRWTGGLEGSARASAPFRHSHNNEHLHPSGVRCDAGGSTVELVEMVLPKQESSPETIFTLRDV